MDPPAAPMVAPPMSFHSRRHAVTSHALMITINVCLDIVVIETSPTYNFTYIDDYGIYAAHGDNLLFKVRAKSDVHVALMRYVHASHSHHDAHNCTHLLRGLISK